MYNFKTQFEIRYSNILDFSSRYKELISPYLKLCTFRIDNTGDIEERIILFFTAEKYLYDIRWDKMLLLSEGPRVDLVKKQGPLMLFFNIFNEISKWPTFGSVQNILLGQWNLLEHKGDLDEIKTQFKKAFFTEKTPALLTGELQDYVITLQNTGKTQFFKMNFGPFDYKSDVNTHALSPLLKKKPDEYKDLSGVIAEHVLQEPATSVNFDKFLSMQQQINDHFKQITL